MYTGSSSVSSSGTSGATALSQAPPTDINSSALVLGELFSAYSLLFLEIDLTHLPITSAAYFPFLTHFPHLNPTLPANFGFTLVMEDKFDSMRLDTKTASCNLRLNLYKHQANNYVCGSRSHTHTHTHTNSCGYVKRLDR